MPAAKKSNVFRNAVPRSLQGLYDFFADDPLGGITPTPTAPLVSIYKNAAARSKGTQEFLKSAVATGIHGLDTAAELFAGKYPRIAAHMRPVLDKDAGLPSMARTQSPYGKVKEPIPVVFSKSQPYPANVMFHEGTHVAQDLGNSDALRLYDLVNEAPGLGYSKNPFEHSADYAGDLAETTPFLKHAQTGKPPNAIKALRELASKNDKNPHFQQINAILERRLSGIPAPMPSHPVVVQKAPRRSLEQSISDDLLNHPAATRGNEALDVAALAAHAREWQAPPLLRRLGGRQSRRR